MTSGNTVHSMAGIQAQSKPSRQILQTLLIVCLGAISGGCILCLAGVTNFGMGLAAIALLTSLFVLPVEYATVAVSFGPLMLIAMRYVDGWYGHYFRWVILFLGLIVCITRIRSADCNYPGPHTSLFAVLMRIYGLTAVATILTSYVPSLTALKAATLVAMIFFCETTSRWLADEAGPFAARRLARSWILFTLPFLVLASGLWLGGDSGSFSDGGFLGTTGNTNSFGALLAFMLPLLVSRFLGARIRFSLALVPWAGLTAVAVYLLYISRSRASLLAFAVAIAVCLFVAPHSHLARIAAGTAVALVLLAMTRPGPTLDAIQAFIYKGGEHRGILGSRMELWETSLQDFLDNPLLGIGYGITDRREANWEVEAATRAFKEERGSSPLAVLSQVGLLGGLPYLLGVLTVAIRATLFAARVHDPWFTGMVASVWAGLVNSLFEGWMASVGNGLLWLLLTQCYLLDAVLSRFRPPVRAAFAMPTPPRRPLREPAAAPAGD